MAPHCISVSTVVSHEYAPSHVQAPLPVSAKIAIVRRSVMVVIWQYHNPAHKPPVLP